MIYLNWEVADVIQRHWLIYATLVLASLLLGAMLGVKMAQPVILDLEREVALLERQVQEWEAWYNSMMALREAEREAGRQEQVINNPAGEWLDRYYQSQIANELKNLNDRLSRMHWDMKMAESWDRLER